MGKGGTLNSTFTIQHFSSEFAPKMHPTPKILTSLKYKTASVSIKNFILNHSQMARAKQPEDPMNRDNLPGTPE